MSSDVSNRRKSPQAVVTASTTGITHLWLDEGQNLFERRTFCGLAPLGWMQIGDADPHERVDCGRCTKAWEKRCGW